MSDRRDGPRALRVEIDQHEPMPLRGQQLAESRLGARRRCPQLDPFERKERLRAREPDRQHPRDPQRGGRRVHPETVRQVMRIIRGQRLASRSDVDAAGTLPPE